MRKAIIVGAAAVAVFAGVIYFARNSVEVSAPAAQSSADKNASADAEKAATSTPAAVVPSDPPQRPVSKDPRLAALMVSPDNSLIEFVEDSDGRVIKEIDNDSGSPGYRKPLREYTYAGDQVIALASYKYLGDQVQTTRVLVTYKPDGSVDQYRESTSYDYGK